MQILYDSTRGGEKNLTASRTILKGLADDGGLFVPTAIPKVDQTALGALAAMDYKARAAWIMGLYLDEFTPEELRGPLGDDAGAFCARFGITAQGNFHGRSIPNLIDAPDWAEASAEIEAKRENES